MLLFVFITFYGKIRTSHTYKKNCDFWLSIFIILKNKFCVECLLWFVYKIKNITCPKFEGYGYLKKIFFFNY